MNNKYQILDLDKNTWIVCLLSNGLRKTLEVFKSKKEAQQFIKQQ